jgi:hypothetical protein
VPTAKVDAATLRGWEAKGLIPPGAVKPKRKPPDVRTGARGGWAVELRLACRVISVQRRWHWSVLRRRTEMQCGAMRAALVFAPFQLGGLARDGGCVVTWTHHGPEMDGDNLTIAFKGLRDELAKLLWVDDGDPRVTWKYDQRPAGKADRGVVVRIEGR